MEAIRDDPERFVSPEEDLAHLPPAPAPFPVELIPDRQPDAEASTAQVNGHNRQWSHHTQGSWITTPKAPQTGFATDHQDVLPPDYDYGRQSMDTDLASLPSYREDEAVQPEEKDKPSDEPAPSQQLPNGSRQVTGDDKMLRELDDVTGAIERLLSASPALQDQRVSLPTPSNGESSTSRRRQILERMERVKMSELEELWDKIEAAHGRRNRSDGQRADMVQGDKRRQKNRFFEGLLDQGEAGRFSDQDSVRMPGDPESSRARKIRDKESFKNLKVPKAGRRVEDQDADLGVTGSIEQSAFMDDIASRSRAGRLTEQEYPTSVQERLEQRRQVLIDNILGFSSAGRLEDQDSAPPTPRRSNLVAEDSGEEMTMDEYLNSEASSTRMDKRGSAMSLSSQSANGGSRSRSGSNGSSVEGQVSAPFRKLAGLVRKSSSGLNLRVPTAGNMDSQSIAYVAEHQENLHTIQVLLHGPGVSSNPDLSLECAARQGKLLSRSGQLSLTIDLPCSVTQQNVQLRNNNLCLEARLSAIPVVSHPSSTSLNSLIPHAMDAAEVCRSNTRTFCCQACDREVAHFGTVFQAKDLPSEHWGEMMEAWMCHSDPSWTARLAKMQEEGFWPEKGQILCGGSYLLIQEEDTNAGNLNVTQTQSEAGWAPISCICGELIGDRRAHDERPGAGVVKLHKWGVYCMAEDGSPSLRFPLSVFIMSDLLESTRAHATYRFAFRDAETGERKLLLWLLNPSIGLSYKRGTGSPLASPARSPTKSPISLPRRPHTTSGLSGLGSPPSLPSSKVLRAGKVLYRVIGSFADSRDLPMGFGPDSQIEDLSYSATLIERLIAMLRDSTAVYPASRRSMNGLEVGFLERV